MAEFAINLEGNADEGAVRAAFEAVVRSLADAIELDGSATIDGVTYPIEEVPEEAEASGPEEAPAVETPEEAPPAP